MPLISTSLKCPECGEKVVKDNKNGEFFCSSCGLVIDDLELSKGETLSYKEKEFSAPMHSGSSTARIGIYQASRARNIYQDVQYQKIPENINAELVKQEVLELIEEVQRQQSLKKFEVHSWDEIREYLFECILGSHGYRYFSGLKGKEKVRVEEILRKAGVRPPRATLKAYIKRMASSLNLSFAEKKEIAEEAEEIAEKIAGAPSTRAAAAMVIACMQHGKDKSDIELAKKFGKAINANHSTIIKAVRSYKPLKREYDGRKEMKKVEWMPFLIYKFIKSFSSASREELARSYHAVKGGER